MKSKSGPERGDTQSAILRCAQTLFYQKGYDQASMDALAGLCGYTKRTIYRYFAGKEDLYFAVLAEEHQMLQEQIKDICAGPGTGLERVKLAYDAYVRFFRAHPALFEMLARMKSVNGEVDGVAALPHYARYHACVTSLYNMMLDLFQQGGVDGTIRGDLDNRQLALSSIFLLNGFFQMLIITGDRYADYFYLDKERFVDDTLQLLTNMLHNSQE